MALRADTVRGTLVADPAIHSTERGASGPLPGAHGNSTVRRRARCSGRVHFPTRVAARGRHPCTTPPEEHAIVSSDTIAVLGICGSLRKGSYNAAALRAAAVVAPADISFSLAGLAGIPLYDEDVRSAGTPDAVSELASAVGAADAVLIATPEYNYSIPGVLKNAIDWLSRLDPQPFAGKPVAIMGASMGRLGTARAQYHLRQVFVFLDAMVLNRPEVMIAAAHTLVDDSGTLTDETTRKFIADQLAALTAYTRRVRG
jgi:chromate reductase